MKLCQVLSVGLLSLALLASCAHVQPSVESRPDLSGYARWIVLPFQTDGFLDRYGAEISDQVVIALLREKPALRIVDRLAGSGRLGETGGDIDSLDLGGIGLSKLGADLVIVGSVLAQLETLNRGDSIRQAYVTATIRAVDAGTGSVIWADRISATAEYRVRDYTYVTDSELREQAIARLATKVAQTLTRR